MAFWYSSYLAELTLSPRELKNPVDISAFLEKNEDRMVDTQLYQIYQISTFERPDHFMGNPWKSQ
jgi:hypothetical protein